MFLQIFLFCFLEILFCYRISNQIMVFPIFIYTITKNALFLEAALYCKLSRQIVMLKNRTPNTI